MFLYGIGIMYTPGPVNTMGFSLGINKKFKESLVFFVGVGVAMFILFVVYGYTGEKLVKKEYLFYISIIGGCYIIYLAYRIFKAKIELDSQSEKRLVSFKDGFFMQLFNPKATLAALPITTISFPSNEIVGVKILIMSLIFMLLVIGAPSTYCLLGQSFSGFMKNKRTFSVLNKIMAVLLLYVAYTIFRDHVYLVLRGVNNY